MRGEREARGGGDGEGIEVEEVLVGDENFVAVFFEVPFGDEGGGSRQQLFCRVYGSSK